MTAFYHDAYTMYTLNPPSIRPVIMIGIIRVAELPVTPRDEPRAIDAALQKLPAFDKARPDNQPDAE